MNTENRNQQTEIETLTGENKLQLEPLQEMEMPEHKICVEITNKRGDSYLDSNFLVEVIAPKFSLKENFSEKKLDQKSGLILVLEHAPNVLKNIFKACKQNDLDVKINMSVEDEIYSTWKIVNPKIVAVNFGVLTTGVINEKRDSFIECEIDFNGIVVDDESIY